MGATVPLDSTTHTHGAIMHNFEIDDKVTQNRPRNQPYIANAGVADTALTYQHAIHPRSYLALTRCIRSSTQFDRRKTLRKLATLGSGMNIVSDIYSQQSLHRLRRRLSIGW